MTVTIEAPPDMEGTLLAQAKEEGLDVPGYVQNLVHGQIVTRTTAAVSRPAYELSAEEWMSQFEAWTKAHAGNTVVLTDEAMERESTYGDRGL
jgi:hypothetical protein